MTKYQKLFYEIKKTNDYKTVGEDIQYKVSVNHNTREVILQFEESINSDDIWHSDWFHNLMFFPWPLKLDNKTVWTTFGYACAYKSTGNLPIDEFEKATNEHWDYRWIIRGWSFGSAMTKIAERHFYIRRNAAIDEELTYGDVKVWINPFVYFLSKKWHKECHNFCCKNDLVTWTIPFFFRHKKCSVGEKLSLKKIFKTEYNHTHYEEYDYSGYECEQI